MKKLGALLVLIVMFIMVIGSVFAYQETKTSAEFTHGGGLGSYCSMTTTVEVTPGSGTQLRNVSYSKSASLGYSFSLQNTPTKLDCGTYDVYVSNNKLLWMSGSTSWDFQLRTTHSY